MIDINTNYSFNVKSETIKSGAYSDHVTKYIITNNCDIKYDTSVIEKFFNGFVERSSKREDNKEKKWWESYYSMKQIDNRTFEFILTEPFLD